MQIDTWKLNLKSCATEYWSSRTNLLVCITVSTPMRKPAEFFWNTSMYVLSLADVTFILPSSFPLAKKRETIVLSDQFKQPLNTLTRGESGSKNTLLSFTIQDETLSP